MDRTGDPGESAADGDETASPRSMPGVDDEPNDGTLEPGSPDPENVFFVLAGIILAIVVIAYGIGLL